MLCQASELSQPRGPCVEVALRLARNVALGGVSLQDWLLACSPCGCPVALSIPLCSALRLALRVDGAPVLMPRAPKCCRLRVSCQPGQHGDVICSAPRAARRRRWLRWSLRCGSRVVSVRPRDEFPHVRVVGQLAESVLSFANDHRGGRDHAGVRRSDPEARGRRVPIATTPEASRDTWHSPTFVQREKWVSRFAHSPTFCGARTQTTRQLSE